MRTRTNRSAWRDTVRGAWRALLVVVATPLVVYAQVPPSSVKPKIPAPVPTLDLPVVTRVMVIETPNMNTPTPFTLTPGQQARLTVQLSKMFTSPTLVQLRYTAGVLQGPATMTVPANSIAADFNVSAILVKTPQSGSVRAWTLDSTKFQSAVLSVVPSLTCTAPVPTIVPAQSTVAPNGTLVIRIGLSCTPSVATTVQLTSSLPGVITPPPGNVITVPALAQQGQYTATIGNASTTTVVTLSASIVGTSPVVRANDVQVVVRLP